VRSKASHGGPEPLSANSGSATPSMTTATKATTCVRNHIMCETRNACKAPGSLIHYECNGYIKEGSVPLNVIRTGTVQYGTRLAPRCWPLNTWPKCARAPPEGFPTFCNHHTEAEATNRTSWLWTHFCFRGLWEDEMFARQPPVSFYRYRRCDPCALVRLRVPCVSCVCPGSPRCLFTGTVPVLRCSKQRTLKFTLIRHVCSASVRSA
jgi:hypothetical protein